MASKQYTLASAVAGALALAAAGPASAVVVVGGDNGWEVSFDGEINQFYTYNDWDGLGTNASRAKTTNPSGALVGGIVRVVGGSAADGSMASRTESRLQTGLLPGFISMNIKAPSWNGIDAGMRFSLAPQTQNARTKNQFNSVSGGQLGAGIDMREMFFTVDGSFGQILAGRTLSLFSAKNLLWDQTLFGVGANVPGNGGTTLGRIGYGYTYAQFNSQVKYTSPDLSGFKIAAGLFDPSQIQTVTEATALGSYNEVSTPRLEAEVSYATKIQNGSIEAFLSGMTQDAEFNGTVPAGAPAGTQSKVTAQGVSIGAKGEFSGFELMASGYTGEALGTTFMLDFDSLDFLGNERDNEGYIFQGGYNLKSGKGNSRFAVSYGASKADETNVDRDCRTGAATCPAGAGAGARIKEQSSFTGGIYHDFNEYLKLVVEYTRQEDEWHDGTSQKGDVFAIGGFFLW